MQEDDIVALLNAGGYELEVHVNGYAGWGAFIHWEGRPQTGNYISNDRNTAVNAAYKHFLRHYGETK